VANPIAPAKPGCERKRSAANRAPPLAIAACGVAGTTSKVTTSNRFPRRLARNGYPIVPVPIDPTFMLPPVKTDEGAIMPVSPIIVTAGSRNCDLTLFSAAGPLEPPLHLQRVCSGDSL
jgi:hypothetical protein